MRRWVKYIVGLTVVGTIAALGGGSALGQTTTSSSASGANYGATTNGNAKAAKVVAKDPMTGPKGTGLTRGVTSTTIKVGCYLNAQSFPNADDGFKARFNRANTTKELPGGRQIDFSGGCKDDGINPQTNLTIVQGLVQQDQDFAVVGIANTLGTASTDFLSQNQVPTLSWSFLPGECGARWQFGFDGCLVTGFPGQKHTVYQANLVQLPIQAAGLQASTAKFALQSQDNDSGHTGNITIGNMVKAVGADPVYVESNIPNVSAGVDLTPFAQAIEAANPNILLTLTDFQTVPALTAKMTATGYKGLNVNYVAYQPGALGANAAFAQALQGATVSTQTVPAEANTKFIQQEEADLKAINAKNGSFVTSAIATAYAEADVLVSMLKATGKTLNTKTFDQKINGGGYTYKSSAAGGPGQMEYPSMHFIAADCAAMMKISGTNYVTSVPFTCVNSIVGK
jgi:hypothetical protein